MIQEVYAIKDELSGFCSPICLYNEKEAVRWFASLVKNNELMKVSPQDYSVWKVGTYDTESGEMKGEGPILIERAKYNGEE